LCKELEIMGFYIQYNWEYNKSWFYRNDVFIMSYDHDTEEIETDVELTEEEIDDIVKSILDKYYSNEADKLNVNY